MKCKNCGAELNNGKCEYCGSVFLEDMRYFIPNIKIDEEKLQAILRKTPIYKGNPYKENDMYMHKVEVRGRYV